MRMNPSDELAQFELASSYSLVEMQRQLHIRCCVLAGQLLTCLMILAAVCKIRLSQCTTVDANPVTEKRSQNFVTLAFNTCKCIISLLSAP
jgi:hypothetical protein